MPEDPAYDRRLKKFRDDLASLSTFDIIRKHITTGVPAAIDDDQYFSLRQIVADEFQLHPSAVILVGSCRTGFSISPDQRYEPMRRGSDLDVAIISAERFDHYWDAVFAYSQVDRAWKSSREYKRFVATLFRGWIDPRHLPNVATFEHARRWNRFFTELTRSRRFGRRGITARLYRSWSRLEAFQAVAVQQCVTGLRGNDAERKYSADK